MKRDWPLSESWHLTTCEEPHKSLPHSISANNYLFLMFGTHNSSLSLIIGVRKIEFHVYNTIPNDLNTSLKGGPVNCSAPQKYIYIYIYISITGIEN